MFLLYLEVKVGIRNGSDVDVRDISSGWFSFGVYFDKSFCLSINWEELKLFNPENKPCSL
jgi:hypothetical protein